MPFGVSLVYVEEIAASAVESVLRNDAETGRDRSAAEVDARRSSEPSRDSLEPLRGEAALGPNEAIAGAVETGVPAGARPVVEDNAPVQVYTTAVGRVVSSRTKPVPVEGWQPAPAEAPWQHAVATESQRLSSQRPAAKLGGVTAASGRPGSSPAQQDRERAIQRIKRRIEKVMPFVYWSSRLRGQVAGNARVRFRLNRHGYVHEIQVTEVTGELELREATHAALHLAEPYVFVPGWIELKLVFRG
jgi:outer membrane biosynthesis protein TonB